MRRGRKRKFVAQKQSDRNDTGIKRRKAQTKEEGNSDRHSTTTSGLTSKSVLSLSGDMANSCLLFLKKRQVVCIRGKAQVQTLVGAADILGYKLKPSSGFVSVFSVISSNLHTITECSVRISLKKTDLKSIMVRTLSSQSVEVIETALSQATNVGTILLVKSLHTAATDIINDNINFRNIFNLDYGKDISHSKVEIFLKKKTSPLGFLLLEPGVQRFGVLKIPDEWNTALHLVQQDQAAGTVVRAPVILICGGKDVGKSTFARFLINSLLNRSREVYYLECDVGQTEFTPPGIVSLNKVSAPLLGPPFTHLSQSERAVFFGDVSPRDKPEFYIRCINDVYESYVGRNVPLVINTQGWVKGLGVPLLLDVIRITKPTHIVQFNCPSLPRKNLQALTHKFLAKAFGWAYPLHGDRASNQEGDGLLSSDTRMLDLPQPVTGEETSVETQKAYLVIIQLEAYGGDSPMCKLFSSDYRTMAVLAYFSGISKISCSLASLYAHTPYRVQWTGMAVHVMHTRVPWNQVLYSLNASVVALAKIDPEKMARPEEDDNTPCYLQETPVTECLGLGIVRNIDPVLGVFYILTPVPPERLQQVNTLLKGNLEIPAALLLKAKQPNAPYVSSEFSCDLRGAGARKVRRNLIRTRIVHQH